MDGADWLRTQLSTFNCSACGRGYRPSQIRVLAQRDALFFVKLSCRACGTHSVAIVTVEVDESETPQLNAGELRPALEHASDTESPVSGDYLLEIHQFLQEFDGDFRGLFREFRGSPPDLSGGK
jgi:hypothetical protein